MTWPMVLVKSPSTLSTERLAPRFTAHAEALGLDREPALAYRPRSRAGTAEELAAELAERVDSDLDRGFTGHGPHRDELGLTRGGRELRAYGSRGQQRLGLLALLLAERDELASVRGAPPLMLLDDVMSELDGTRRERLIDILSVGGQSVITTTDLAHVPRAEAEGVTRLAIVEGAVQQTDDARSDRSDQPPSEIERTERADPPGRGGPSEQPEWAERSGRPERPEATGRVEWLGRPEPLGWTEQAERARARLSAPAVAAA